MKISTRNTALGLLDKMDESAFRIIDDGGETTFDQKQRLAQSLIRIWPNISPRFARKKQLMSEPFYEAYERGAHKMAKVLDADDLDEGGVLIYKPSVSETNTVFYSIMSWGKDKDYEIDATILIFNNHTNRDKPSLGILAQRRPGMPLGGARFYASKHAQVAGVTPTSVIVDILTMVLFMKHCPLETKIISAGRKDIHIGTKYVNETRSDVQILDSTYFTTIVKSEGFHVRGHYRWQPCGAGLKDRELIWISDYDKDGYTRTAKVLSNPQ
jgi:hypothetical protein